MKSDPAKHTFFLFLLLLLTLPSCNDSIVYTGSGEMAGAQWKLREPVSFRIPLNDTALSTNIYFTLRTGSEYPFRNIWLFVNTLSPDGKSLTDTIEYFLADERGNRAGRGFGEIKEIILPYRTNVYFPSAGVWQFRIHHGMRTEDLRGVYDLGLTIGKNQPKNR